MGERRVRKRGPKYRAPFACGLTALLVLPLLVPRPSLASDSNYDTLVARLSLLVSQRSVLLARISAADGVVGSTALADILGGLRSPLEAQATEARRFAGAWAAIPSPTQTPSDPAFYRGAEAGAMLGPNQPLNSMRNSSDTAATEPGAARIAQLAGERNAPVETAPLLPPVYSSLSTAQDPAPPRAIGDDGIDALLRTVAPQAVSSSPPTAAVAAPPGVAPTLVHGAAAAKAYAGALSALAPALGSVEVPASLSSIGVTAAARPRAVADLQTLLGHYLVPPAAGRNIQRSEVTGTITWDLSASRPASNGTTLQVQGSGSVSAGRPGPQTYSVFSTTGSTNLGAPAPLSVRIDIAPAGSALLTATTILTDGTSVQLTARLPNALSDPRIARAVAAEQAPLNALGGVLSAGNAVYAALTPLYQARAGVYQQALGVAMRQNAAMEQRWWDQTQRWDAYQTALGQWKQKRAAWLSYLARTRPGGHGSSLVPTLTATPLGDFGPAASATPTPDSHLVPGPGIYRGGAAGKRLPALGVGGGPVERVAALAAVTPIFAATVPDAPSPSATLAITSTTSLTGTTVIGLASPTATPSDSVTPSPSESPSAIPTSSPTLSATDTPAVAPSVTATPTSSPELPATATDTPVVTASRSATTHPSPSPTSAPVFVVGAGTGSATAMPSATLSHTPTPSATSTAEPTAVSTQILSDTAVPAESATRASTASPTATNSAIPSATASPTATLRRAPSATPTRADRSPTATATAAGASHTLSGLLNPGPPPAAVPPPGGEPQYVPLPAPLSPLPPWVTAPIEVTPSELSLFESFGPNARGYASMTASQLIAGGALENVSGYIPPLQGVITTFWGGSTPFQSFHPGVDIATAKDTPVHAAADGIVVYAGLAVPGQPTQSYGNCVVILHNAHISTLYGHMDMGQYGLQVQAGQVVRQGQVIGYEGQTGWATGPHVHFEMRLDNVQFDPLLLISEGQITG